MYKCQDCGTVFAEPKKEIERHGFAYGGYETFYTCPCCGGGYDELQECVICGEDFVNDFDIFERPYCPKCRQSLIERLSAVTDNEFTIEEKEALFVILGVDDGRF